MRTGRQNPMGGASGGFTIIEVGISLALLMGILLASATAFSSSLQSAGQAERNTEAGIFMENVMENAAAQPYDNLIFLDGTLVYDQTDANDSDFVVALNVFPLAVDLLQIRAVLTDLQSGRVLARLATQRCRR